MFQVNHLNLIYDMEKEEKVYAVNDVSLTLPEHGLIGIIGPSGSGKSSLMYCLSTLKQATSGDIIYKGKAYGMLSRMELERLRREEFGFVFQHHFLIGYMSAMDNVVVAADKSKAEEQARAEKLLTEMSIKRADLGKKPKQLSGGQRQRVAIARALINEPNVVFADEPTASLDHENAFRVMNYLKEYAKEHLVIVITHDHSILKDADRVIEIWDGKVNAGKEQV